MNEVLKTIKERSSIRAYTDEKLTKEEINAVITAALQAPTARNMQEVHVSVVDGDNPILKEIDTDRKIKLLQMKKRKRRLKVIRTTFIIMHRLF